MRHQLQVTENDNKNTISISAESREEADKLFNAHSEGGKIEMQIADNTLGSYFGMLVDKFGTQWVVDQKFDKINYKKTPLRYSYFFLLLTLLQPNLHL